MYTVHTHKGLVEMNFEDTIGVEPLSLLGYIPSVYASDSDPFSLK